MSHSTHNRSFRRRVFPGKRLHWYWQPKNKQTKYYIRPKHKWETKNCHSYQNYLHPDLATSFLARKQSGPYSYSPEPTQGDNVLSTLLNVSQPWSQCVVSECVGFNAPLDIQQVISVTSLSRQSIALVLTTKNNQTQHYIHQKQKRNRKNCPS